MKNLLQHLNGRTFTLSELFSQLSILRISAGPYFPPEIGVREMLDILHDSKWLQEVDGKLKVLIPEEKKEGAPNE